jgi:hypothetical protein
MNKEGFKLVHPNVKSYSAVANRLPDFFQGEIVQQRHYSGPKHWQMPWGIEWWPI